MGCYIALVNINECFIQCRYLYGSISCLAADCLKGIKGAWTRVASATVNLLFLFLSLVNWVMGGSPVFQSVIICSGEDLVRHRQTELAVPLDRACQPCHPPLFKFGPLITAFTWLDYFFFQELLLLHSLCELCCAVWHYCENKSHFLQLWFLWDFFYYTCYSFLPHCNIGIIW